MPIGVGTYSFMDVAATISGPGGVIMVGSTSGSAEEGITKEMVEDKDTMNIGADGYVQHNLHAGNAGRWTIRLLKTSPTNGLLQSLYNFQKSSSATWGQNVLTVSDIARGDVSVLRSAAFARQPRNAYSKDGPALEWEFLGGVDDTLLGNGAPAL